MKTLNILLVLIIVSVAQATAQQSFCSISLEKVRNRNLINFSVPKEVNVRQYRVEAGNDSTDFAVIGAVHAEGNSVFSKDYYYEVFGPTYKYYRVAIDGMGAGLKYSKIVSAPQKDSEQLAPLDAGKVLSCSALADNH